MDDKTLQQVQLYAKLGELLYPLGVALASDLKGLIKDAKGEVVDLSAILDEADANWKLVIERAKET